MIKLLKHFVILLIVAIVTTLGYGFLIGGELSDYYYIFESITLVALSLLLSRKTLNKKFVEQFTEMMVMVGLIIGISVFSYTVVNDFSGELVAEYDAKVTESYGPGKGDFYSAHFIDSQGEVGGIDYYAGLEFSIDPDKYPYEGDTIHVKEYKGLFGLTYYESDSWENTNPYYY